MINHLNTEIIYKNLIYEKSTPCLPVNSDFTGIYYLVLSIDEYQPLQWIVMDFIRKCL